MIILGIDPGDTRAGFGVIQKKGGELFLVACGCIETPSRGMTVPEKLAALDGELTGVIKKYRPDVAAVEELFFAKNAKTGIRVAEARGVILAVCEKNRVPVLEFTPLEIKQALTGYGRAEKKQVKRMVQLILKTEKLLHQGDDAVDAVAAAICASSDISLREKGIN